MARIGAQGVTVAGAESRTVELHVGARTCAHRRRRVDMRRHGLEDSEDRSGRRDVAGLVGQRDGGFAGRMSGTRTTSASGAADRSTADAVSNVTVSSRRKRMPLRVTG